jgi:Spy/CpxP family protein refolding chaperone
MTNFILSTLAAAGMTLGAGATAVAVSPDVIAASSTESQAAPSEKVRGKRAKRGEGKFGHLCAKAECTPEQRDELRGIGKAFRSDTKPQREQMRQLRKGLVNEFVKDEPNEREMARIYRELDQLQDAITERRHEMLMDTHGKLTSEQRRLAAQALLKPGKRGHGKKGRKGKKDKQFKKGEKRGKGPKSKGTRDFKSGDKR